MLEKLSKEELMNLNNARILYYDFFNGFFVFELLDDRVEILNPGALYGANKIEKLGTDTIMESRNPTIVRIDFLRN